MKQDIFELYLRAVARHHRMTEEEVLAQSKRTDLVAARHLLYYLCHERGIGYADLKRYLLARGYTVKYPSIRHGIHSVKQALDNDPDYYSIVNKLK